MFTKILYILAGTLLIISLFKSKTKTKQALKKAWKSFEAILPQLFTILFIIGLTLSWLDPKLISRILGSESGLLGTFIAGVIGALTLIPAFIAFPLAAVLRDNGAGTMQVVAFVSTLMMVGIVTVPLETKTLGLKVTVLRNSMAFILSFVVAIIMGVFV